MKPVNQHRCLAFVTLLSVAVFWVNWAAAEILFKADFETGDFSQFSGKSKNIKPGHIEVVSDIVHSGKHAGRFSIHEDNVFNARQLRVQVNGPKVTVKEGTDNFVSFYMYMKDPPKDRDNFFYWEGSPPPRYNNVMTWWVEPSADGAGTRIKFGTGNLGRKGVHWDADFTTGRWHQLGMHIHWSEDPAKGNAKIWWDGVVVLDKKVQTKGPQTAYFSQPGIHRDPHAKSVDTIYFDDILCATTLEEIAIQKPKATSPKFLKGWGEPIDPDGDCSIDLENGKLTIKVPGTRHGLEAESNTLNAPRVLRDIEGDFIADLKVHGEFKPGGASTSEGGFPFQGAGLLLWSDEGNYLRLERAAIVRDNQLVSYYLFEERRNQIPVPPGGGIQAAANESNFLRLERKGDEVFASVSADGKNWKAFPSRTVRLPAKLKLGVAVISSASEPFTVTLQDFRVLRPE